MDYDSLVNAFVDYFEAGEKDEKDLRIGIELEHFIVDKDYKTVSYYGEGGIAEILKKLEKSGIEGKYEGENILGLYHDNFTVTLEPGAQLEFSAKPQRTVKELEEEYRLFEELFSPVLEEYGYSFINLGYSPKKKIDEIKRIPGDRYTIMYDYFKDKGKCAHNMMKGTASLQIAIDYTDEKDFRKKFYVANALTPILYAIFDNAPIFEGERYKKNCLRTMIWENTDNARSGLVPGAFSQNFSYEDYAEYILETPPMLVFEEGKAVATGEKKVKDVYAARNLGKAEVEHVLSTVFPDVRLRNYVEIRQADSVPIEYALGLVAFIKGIFYNKDNLNELYDFFRNVNDFILKDTKEEIIEEGIETEYAQSTVYELFDRFLTDAKYTLPDEERAYLKALERLVNSEDTLKNMDTRW